MTQLNAALCPYAKNQSCDGVPTLSYSLTNVSTGVGKTTSLPVPALPASLAWRGVISQISDNGRYALVSAWAPQPAAPGRANPGDRFTSQRQREQFLVVDLEQGGVIGQVARENAPALFSVSPQATYLDASNPDDLALVSSNATATDGKAEVVISRYRLADRRLSARRISAVDEISVESLGYWTSQGFDLDHAAAGCALLRARRKSDPGECEIIGPTPDQRYWLIGELPFGQEGVLALVDAKDGSIAGALTLFDSYAYPITGPAYAKKAGALLLTFGADAEIYSYAAPRAP